MAVSRFLNKKKQIYFFIWLINIQFQNIFIYIIVYIFAKASKLNTRRVWHWIGILYFPPRIFIPISRYVENRMGEIWWRNFNPQHFFLIFWVRFAFNMIVYTQITKTHRQIWSPADVSIRMRQLCARAQSGPPQASCEPTTGSLHVAGCRRRRPRRPSTGQGRRRGGSRGRPRWSHTVVCRTRTCRAPRYSCAGYLSWVDEES